MWCAGSRRAARSSPTASSRSRPSARLPASPSTSSTRARRRATAPTPTIRARTTPGTTSNERGDLGGDWCGAAQTLGVVDRGEDHMTGSRLFQVATSAGIAAVAGAALVFGAQIALFNADVLRAEAA